ncbi:hypothetical protein CPJCM30710_26590 [Clostridium polyendosporum]|uniref:Uncharacterized protein n=1 Tax=Clostridium polyendosporum TaxID=69208 RepID=A0A919S3L5_9CLOT|nr:hypothetical protein [Clostridium polyendosporum]GIM29993.1 hypothetical protein CPJCM30710_26590 [Clostridium polyendosporum]
MKVVFQFYDKNGQSDSANNIEKDLSSDEIMVLLKSKEIAYPVNTGFLFTIKHCEIENSVYDMFTEPYKLIIKLKEKN